jgi:hypothetical protein
MGFQETFVGSGERYDYHSMCIPQIPCTKAENRKKVNFYTLGEFFLLLTGSDSGTRPWNVLPLLALNQEEQLLAAETAIQVCVAACTPY